ncbi:DMT family transporter [Haloarculaceae archaeon H-GB2-1]|nr:DMT family transporter [Haloarculaceae archaeon H-GB11]MEA5409409.1 DMT family transporter [Haloarculaceae archaeon H-GB2-1]
MAAFRFDLGAAVLLGYAGATGREWIPRTRRDAFAIAAGGALFIAIGNGLAFIGQLTTTAGLASILFSLIPLLVVAFSWVFLPSERPSAVGIAGLLLALVGVVVLVQPDPGNLLTPNFVGVLFVLVAVIGSALGSVLVRRWPATLPSVSATAWAMALGAVLLHASSLATETDAAGISPSTWSVLSLFYLGCLTSAIGYGLYFALLRRLTAFEVNLVSYVIPVVASLGGWLLLGEEITDAMIGGFAIIALGFAVLKRRAVARELQRTGVTNEAD